jgi:CelD/BcsL family acetyltransferase involved in cellulose biosynthesis
MVWSLRSSVGVRFMPQNDAIKLRSPEQMNALMTVFDTTRQKSSTLTGGLHLRVFENLDAVQDIWLALEQSANGTCYQSFTWCKTWVDQLAAIKNIKPYIVVAENEYGTVEFILPLQLRQKNGLKIIEILTAPQAGYAYALFQPAFLKTHAHRWFLEHFEFLIASLPQHDVFTLMDLPGVLFGNTNPILQARNFLAANLSHVLDLDSDYETLFKRRRSKASRRSIFKRDVKLEALPGLKFELCVGDDVRIATLSTMFDQQEKRLAGFGIFNIFDASERAFFHTLVLAKSAEGHILRLYKLSINEEVLAVMLGGYQRGVFWALISSMDEGKLVKLSPGDYALRKVFQDLCRLGTGVFDFSAGDSRYKHHWSDRRVPLHFIVRGNSLRGITYAVALLLREKVKRLGKQTPFLNTLLFELRRIVRGRQT